MSSSDIRTLRQAIEREGLFERRSRNTWVRFTALLVITASLLVLAVHSPWWLAIPLFPLASLTLTIAALNGHEGGHHSLSERSWENAFMLHLAFPLMSGMGAIHWCAKHNVGHHGHPNVINGDPDLDLWPMATSRADYEASGWFRRGLQKNFQAVAFWPLTLLLVPAMRVESMRALKRHYRKHGADRAFWQDVACLSGHYLGWLVIPSMIFGPLPALGFYLALWAPVGLYLAGIFVGAHFGLPVVSKYEDPWVLQLATTRNITLPVWARWTFVGLDYQVEHHIFPRIPHANMPRAAVHLQAFCEARGLPYMALRLWPSLVAATHFMDRAWDELPVAVGGVPEAASTNTAAEAA